jgi:hypothetical protein
MIVSFKGLMAKYTIAPENLYLLAESIRVIDDEQEIRKAEQLVTAEEEAQYEVVKSHMESLAAHNNNVEYVHKLIDDLRKQLRHWEIEAESFDQVGEMLKASQYDEFLKLCEIQGVPAWNSCWWLGSVAIPMPEPPVRAFRNK